MIQVSLDFERLVTLVLPPFLRKTRIIKFLYACLSPLEGLNQNELYDMVESARELLNHTSEVGILSNLLNDKYDTTLRRIRIGDASAPTLPVFMHQAIENQTPPYMNFNDGDPPVTMRFQAEFSAQVDFVVYVPSSFNASQVQFIKNVVNQHRLAGKTYKIEFV